MTDTLDVGSFKPIPDTDLDANQIANALTAVESWANAVAAEIDALDLGTIPTDLATLQSEVATLQGQVAGLGSWVTVTGAWTLASSDSPIFVLTAPSSMATTLYPGVRLKITDTTDKYGIVVKVADTTVSVWVESSVSIATNPTAVAYSYGDTPPGFPRTPTTWDVTLSDASDRTKASPSGTTWYLFDAALKIDIPVGGAEVFYRVAAEVDDSGANIGMYVSLSTSQTSESDTELTSLIRVGGTSALAEGTLTGRKTIIVSAKTAYYLIGRSAGSGATSINFRGSAAHPTVVRARCAYL